MVEGAPVNAAYLKEGEWTVAIADRIYPAVVSFRPFYDPRMEKVRA